MTYGTLGCVRALHLDIDCGLVLGLARECFTQAMSRMRWVRTS